jgi:hypothetical protein
LLCVCWNRFLQMKIDLSTFSVFFHICWNQRMGSGFCRFCNSTVLDLHDLPC